MFTPKQRDDVRERVLEMARSDPRVTSGAITGSMARDAMDQWSDIDLAFGLAEGIDPDAVLHDWSEALGREFGVLDHFDLRAGAAVYRVFLLPSGLEIDIAALPASEFGARGAAFRSLFGDAGRAESVPQPDARHLIGLAWHHVLHARSCIERGKPWQAEYWISGVRDHALTLACLRLGESAYYARGVDRLPADVTAPLAEALVCSLDAAELRRALAAATACLIGELEQWDAALCARLSPLLREFGASSATLSI